MSFVARKCHLTLVASLLAGCGVPRAPVGVIEAQHGGSASGAVLVAMANARRDPAGSLAMAQSVAVLPSSGDAIVALEGSVKGFPNAGAFVARIGKDGSTKWIRPIHHCGTALRVAVAADDASDSAIFVAGYGVESKSCSGQSHEIGSSIVRLDGSGRQVWQYRTDAWSNTPFELRATNKTVAASAYGPTYSSITIAVSADSGHELWQRRGDGEPDREAPLIANGAAGSELVLSFATLTEVLGASGLARPEGRTDHGCVVRARAAATGESLWQTNLGRDGLRCMIDHPGGWRPSADGRDVLVVGTDRGAPTARRVGDRDVLSEPPLETFVAAVSIETGELHYRHTVHLDGAPSSSRPALGRDELVLVHGADVVAVHPESASVRRLATLESVPVSVSGRPLESVAYVLSSALAPHVDAVWGAGYFMGRLRFADLVVDSPAELKSDCDLAPVECSRSHDDKSVYADFSLFVFRLPLAQTTSPPNASTR